MKKALLFVMLILSGAAAAAVASYWLGTHGVRTMMQAEDRDLVWLKQQFQLNDAQVQIISGLNRDYAPVCEKNCARIEAAHSRLNNLVATSADVTPDLTKALEDVTRLRADCTGQMLAHVYQVAAVMNPEQRQRYIDFMNRRITGMGYNGMIPSRER